MGTSREHGTIASALFNGTRMSVLALLFSHAQEEFYFRQIVYSVGGGIGSVSRELRRLTDAGILHRRIKGSNVYYQANSECPVFNELKGLIVKTAGIADIIRSALISMSDRISIAFIYGSFAKGEESATSDVDIMIAGDIDFADAVSALETAQETLGREINPSVYSLREYRKKLRTGHRFLTSVVNGPKIMLLGDEDEFGAPGEKRTSGKTRS